ncbi:cytochrome c oxidase subunit II [Haloplanus aerogenes]|uniref:cytochrome-c oxidase n=1 Tax=Haloplanus aerogenes TaxID=660522 RepID=A0A3M0CSY5_9EURY|nr:cytochrome c oxidase subunit II [Haloplanus aerogenes]RMB12598.1 cytochrome c oxidase subunit 2 [Haloplanus aerogenes]
MKRTRWLAGAGGVALAATLLATPAAAQSVNRAAIDELNTQLLYVALPLALFVEVTLVYAIYRFRDNDDPSPTVDDPALEITWTAATAVILLFVGVSAYVTMANPYLTPAAADAEAAGDAIDDMVIEVDAYQWGWAFHYPESNVTTEDRLTIPADRDVRLVLSSRDVIHSIYVPALGIKQDIIPGSETVARTRATETGEYRLYCAELCGDGHARMHGQVAVLNETTYEAWEEEQSADG